MLESKYQSYLISKIESLLPGCIVLKNDSALRQGIPDLLILFENRWGVLEVKVSQRAAIQPNQEYWIDRCDQMSFGAFIYPENEEAVLDDLQQTLGAGRPTRVSFRK